MTLALTRAGCDNPHRLHGEVEVLAAVRLRRWSLGQQATQQSQPQATAHPELS